MHLDPFTTDHRTALSLFTICKNRFVFILNAILYHSFYTLEMTCRKKEALVTVSKKKNAL